VTLDYRSQLPTELLEPLEALEAFFGAHYPQVRLFIVGGGVRDMVMRRRVKDLDIECFGIEPDAFDAAMTALGAKGVGKSFFVYKYGPLDVALPRTERKVGPGHRGFAVSLARDTREASRRRDFTMNALMVSVKTGELVDHWGGMRDIARRRIRVVDPHHFMEDSLRVLRAMQFSARLGFRIEPASEKLMAAMDLSDLTRERIFLEFEKMFEAAYLHYGLYAMIRLEIDRKILHLQIDRKAFFLMAGQMVKARRFGTPALRPYYFLYILSAVMHLNGERLCQKLHTPRRYPKTLAAHPRPPGKMTDRFLGAVALRYPLASWLGIYADHAAERARRLGVYDHPFDPGVTAEKLMQEGLKGADLGRELRRRRLQAVKEMFGR
jgi:tRNA nucleotidyltransferase (CCA-adding enzyme)